MRALSLGLALPLGVFLLVRIVLSVAALNSGYPPLKAGVWCRGDSGLYFSVAMAGYSLGPCPSDGDEPETRWCGNAGWLPGYPLLIRVLRGAGLPVRPAAVLLSGLFGLLTLWLLSASFLDGRPPADRLTTLLLAGFFPGHIYYHAAFPLSLFTFLVLLTLRELEHGRFGRGGLAGSGAAFTYPPGLLLGPVAAAWLLTRPGAWRTRLARAAATGALVVAGFGAVLLLLQLSVGAWDAFFRVQAKYHFEGTSPLATWATHVLALLQPPWEGRAEAPAAQTLLVGLWATSLLAANARRAWRDPGRPRLLAFYTLALWVFPLCLGGTLSLYRSESVLLPSVLLADGLPRWAKLAFLIGAAGLSYPMARLFFETQLV